MVQETCPYPGDVPGLEDLLDFTPYRDTILDLLKHPALEIPLTIGIFGDWGVGKTTLMMQVKEKLTGDRFRTVWFDAWKYDREAVVWRALLLRVLDELRPPPEDKDKQILREEIERLEEGLYRDVVWKEKGGIVVNLGELLGGVASGIAQFTLPFGANMLNAVKAALGKKKGAEEGLINAFHRDTVEHYQAQLRSIEQFQDKFSKLVDEHITKKGQRLVVFVDDLDRCLPEKAVEVLEAIKLFLDVRDCLFILGLNQEVITQGIKVRYRDFAVAEGPEGREEIPIDGAKYLEKIIQLPFLLPPIEPERMEQFVEKHMSSPPDKRCIQVVALGLEPNPRRVKRVIRVFVFLWALSRRKKELKDQIKPVRLAKVVVIQQTHPDLYNLLIQDSPLRLKELEEYFRMKKGEAQPEEEPHPVGKEKEEGTETAGLHPHLAPFKGYDSLGKLLTLHPVEGPESEDANFADLTPDEIRAYLTLARTVVAEVAPAGRLGIPVPQTVRIPAGEFLMGTSDGQARKWIKKNEKWVREWQEKGWLQYEQPQHRIELPDYRIGKYPVTNYEYQVFVKDTDQTPPSFWEGDSSPEGKGDHPVVGVSWQDAAEYCRWLSGRAKGAFRLPTEAEWEKAASWDEKGGKKQTWPWGDEWNAERCNTKEGGPGETTPVGQYSPAGDSPLGVADMAGNVWEWCQGFLKPYPYKADDGREDLEASGRRVLRGGSWIGSRHKARSAVRRELSSGRWLDFIGFRVAVVSSS